MALSRSTSFSFPTSHARAIQPLAPLKRSGGRILSWLYQCAFWSLLALAAYEGGLARHSLSDVSSPRLTPQYSHPAALNAFRE